MKIVIITTFWKNSNGGGVTNYLTSLADEFKARNLDINVIFNSGLDSQNYHVQNNKVIFSLKSYFLLNDILPDVIYSQATWYCLLAGYLYKKKHPVELIHTFHTEPTEKLSFFGKVFFQHLINKCDCVTFVSKNLKDKTEKILGLRFKKTEITYAGVSSPCEISDTKICKFYEQFKIKKGSIILLAHGLTSYRSKAEGAKLLIKAVKKLKIDFPNIILILTKEGSFSKELKDFSKYEGVSESIIFTGNLKEPNIPLKICNLYTHTPLIEGGVSLAVLEAMAMGKPILATSVGGIPEAIENGVNGLLVQPDADIIAQKIAYLLENEEFAFRLGLNAQKTAREKFNWKTSADTFLRLNQR
jgi:L-malate glycosyltransferase